MTRGFYVYVWHDRGLPVYVGKGRGGRAGAHLRDKVWAEGRQLSCNVYPFGTERSALWAESRIIAAFGIKKEGGPLENVRREPLAETDPGMASEDVDQLTSIVWGFDYPNREPMERVFGAWELLTLTGICEEFWLMFKTAGKGLVTPGALEVPEAFGLEGVN